MNTDKRNTSSISARFTHGTAKKVLFQSVIPSDKAEKEVFWTTELMNKLKNNYEIKRIVSNDDDSHGNHDVLIIKNDESIIGVQVTELTYELERARKNIKETYIKKLLELVKVRDIKSQDKIIFNISFPYSETRKPALEKPKMIVDTIDGLIKEGIKEKAYQFDFGTIFCQKITKGEIYIRNINNIGVDVNFDDLPRSLELYLDCIDAIISKKSKSLSSWLVIWSKEFWRDRQWLEKEVIDYLKSQFRESKFEKVFFIESMDRKEFFHPNLKLDEIK